MPHSRSQWLKLFSVFSHLHFTKYSKGPFTILTKTVKNSLLGNHNFTLHHKISWQEWIPGGKENILSEIWITKFKIYGSKPINLFLTLISPLSTMFSHMLFDFGGKKSLKLQNSFDLEIGTKGQASASGNAQCKTILFGQKWDWSAL